MAIQKIMKGRFGIVEGAAVGINIPSAVQPSIPTDTTSPSI